MSKGVLFVYKDDLEKEHVQGAYVLSNFQVSDGAPELRLLVEQMLAKPPFLAKLEPDKGVANAPLAIDTRYLQPISLRELWRVYGIAFVWSSNVRVGFWEIVRLHPAPVDINSMLDEMDTHRSSPQVCLACFKGETSIVHFDPSFRIDESPQCERWVLAGEFQTIIRRVARSHDLRQVKVAISWLFMSSFGITILIYVGLIVYVIVRSGVWLFRFLVSEGYFDTDKSPFHVLALPVATILSLISCTTVTIWYFFWH